MMELDSTDNPGRLFFALSRDLKSIALSNIQYFQSGKQSHHAKFHVNFCLLYEYLDIGIEPTYRELAKLVSEYDFSPEIKGNGYRSLLRVVQKCCLHLLQLTRYISSVRDSMLFRKKVYSKELESYVSALGQLRAVLYYALKLTQYCQQGQLFADEEQLNSDIAEALMLEVESLSQEFFYGRCLGFQYCESMQRPLQAVGIIMASLSEGYLESSHVMRVATSVFNSGKYILDPELRAKQMVKVTRTAGIRFCQTFWNFPESPIMQQLPSFVCPVMEVNEILTLGPDAFELPLVDGSDTVVITPPCAHTGPAHVYTRLISAHLREGQQALKKSGKTKSPTPAKPRVPGLIVHFHGGGFVAQSSKSHEVYLRDWAVSIGCPILSVDYSLAPQAPFPRALEECFYAYAWAVKNCEQLGSTGKRIIVVGDSAGGNLAISTALRAASFGIRPPDGAVVVYPCTVVKYTPSPARLLSLMDPLLPVGLMARCLAAYAGINEEEPLASPTMHELHSEESLERIRFGSYESTDLDWIIIAQDEEEMRHIRSVAAETPSCSGSGKEVMADTLDDLTDSGDLLEDDRSRGGTGQRLSHGGGQGEGRESEEEVEIFSQLLNQGSCVFPSEGEVTGSQKDHQFKPHSPSKSTNPVVKTNGSNGQTTFKGDKSPILPPSNPWSAIAKNTIDNHNRAGKGEKSSGIAMFQTRAKQMMAGAQNMLTSLSSYMPATPSMVTARSVMSSLTSFSSPSSVHTSRSSPVLASSAPGCDLPDIDTFVELAAVADHVHPDKSETLRSSPGQESQPGGVKDSGPRGQEDALHNRSTSFDSADIRSDCSSLGHNENNLVNETVTTSDSGGDEMKQQSVSPVETVEVQSRLSNSSSSSGVFETPFSTPLSPPPGGDCCAMFPAAESNLSLSSAFVSDTSPHQQGQGQTEIASDAGKLEKVSRTNVDSVDETRELGDECHDRIDEVTEHLLAPGDLPVTETSGNLVDSDKMLLEDPSTRSVEASNLAVEDHTDSQPIPTGDTVGDNVDMSPSGNIDKSPTVLTPELPRGSFDQTENAVTLKDQDQLAPLGSAAIPPTAVASSDQLSSECMDVCPKLELSPMETTTSTGCLQTLDMLSPLTPSALATSREVDNREASRTSQLPINTCALDEPVSRVSSQTDQPSSSPSSPQQPIICEVDTFGDSPASLASLPMESKELLEDALMSEDMMDSEENLSHSVDGVNRVENVSTSVDGTGAKTARADIDKIGDQIDPQHSSSETHDSEMFGSCISDRPSQSLHDSYLTPLPSSGSKPRPGQDSETGSCPDQQDPDVQLWESPQKRCYSPPTSLNIATASWSGLPDTAAKVSGSQPVVTATTIPSVQIVVGTTSSKPTLPSVSQAYSSPTLPVVQSSPITSDSKTTRNQRGTVDLSATPVVTVTPTESGGHMRVWPVGVGMRTSGSSPALSSVLALSPESPSPEKTEDKNSRKKTSQDTSAVGFLSGLKTGMSPSDFELQNFSSHSPLHLLRRAAVVKNPYMSPLTASDEMLQGLTHVSIVGCQLDPLLDDSVMFAKRLRDLDIPVDLHLVDDLPHGFLNFALLSVEARQAADLCGRKISDMLREPDMDTSASIM